MFKLEPFQRVVLRNGSSYIAMPVEASSQHSTSDEQFSPIFLVNDNGFTDAKFKQPPNYAEWEIVEVYEKPNVAGHALRPLCRGKLLWSLIKVEQRLKELKAQRDLLNNEIAKLEGN